jgi:hypothetical protein
MNKIVFVPTLLITLFLISCNSSQESKLIGTWKVTEVETDFDADRTNPQMIKQVVETQKQTFFKIVNDTLMVIISTGNTYEAKWKLNPDDKRITYTFNDWDGISSPFNLGIYTGNQIVTESELAIGKMTVYFEKE